MLISYLYISSSDVIPNSCLCFSSIVKYMIFWGIINFWMDIPSQSKICISIFLGVSQEEWGWLIYKAYIYFMVDPTKE